MAVIKKRYNDNERGVLLKKAIETGKSDRAKNNNFVSEDTLVTAETLLQKWVNATLTLNSLLSNREKETREKNEAFSELEMYVRDIWDSIKRRVRRLKEPAEVLTYYELPLSGMLPKHIKQSSLISIASKIVAGDAKAEKAGYQPINNPTATELQQIIQRAEKEYNDIAPADRAYDQASEKVENLRTKIDIIIDDILAELQFTLRKKDNASARRIIRTYGFQIISSVNGKPADETEEIEEFTQSVIE